MNKLKKIFNNNPPDPSDPFIKQIEEAIKKSHEERWCLSCAHCVPEDDSLPSFVTTSPTCDLSGDAAIKNCDKYKERMTLEEELRALYGKEEKGKDMEKETTKETLKAAANTNPNSLAGAIAGIVREQGGAEIQVVGAGALNQAVKGIAIARGFMAPSGVDLVAIPSFHNFETEGKERTAMRIQVEPR